MYVSVSSKNLSTVYYKELSGCTMLAHGACQGAMLAVPAAGLEDATVDEDPVLTYTERFRPLWKR